MQIDRSFIKAHMKYFEKSDKTSQDEELGKAIYYHIVVGEKRLENGAWYFEDEKAGKLKGLIGFRTCLTTEAETFCGPRS